MPRGHRALYRRASRLFDELTLARADGTYVRLLDKVARIDVLIVDDWGLLPVKLSERHDLLDILEDRHENRSTILTSQLPPAKWYDHLADPTIADAILDRLVNKAHRLVKRPLPPQGGVRRQVTHIPASLRSVHDDRSR